MKRILTAVAAFAALQACGGTEQFPDTDVAEIDGFRLETATGVKMSGGKMQTGTLEYKGMGDMNTVYRDYVAAMKSMGWVAEASEIESAKATATLKKDTRTCTLNFTAAQQGHMSALIKVSQTGSKSP